MLCQIGAGEYEYVINVEKCKIDPLLPYLKSNKWKKVIQNAKFEQKFFQYYYKTKIENTFDTFLAELILNPDARGSSSLAALVSKYLGESMSKDTRKSFVDQRGSDFSEEQIKYAAKDVEVLFPIMEKQSFRAEELSLEKIFDLEFELAGVVADMELVGVPVDTQLWKTKLKVFEEEHEASRLKMHEILFDDTGLDEQLGLFARDAINLNSPKQLKNAFIKLGIDIDSTNEREIALINHPAAVELLNYRGLQKILTSYGSSFLEKIHPFTNRIHADFQQMGTETGRFSCREPNLQQMPASFRECVSQAGYMIVGADYSQIELRILAELSGDPAFIRAFSTGHDLHKSTAALMFNIPIDSVSKEQRFIAKTINFGISYGMGTTKLMDMLNAEARKNKTPLLKFPQVQAMMNKYHSTYRKVSEWLTEAGMLAYRQGYSETMYGRKRFYTRPDPKEWTEKEYTGQVAAIKRKGANSPIQGTNADITKMAMVNVYNELKDAGYRSNMIIQVHDEIVLLARKEQAEDVKNLVESTMRKAATGLITKVPVVADSYISQAWKK